MYNSGASASVFQTEHVNYKSASRGSAGRASGSMRGVAVHHPRIPPILGRSRASWLAGSLGWSTVQTHPFREAVHFTEWK